MRKDLILSIAFLLSSAGIPAGASPGRDTIPLTAPATSVAPGTPAAAAASAVSVNIYPDSMLSDVSRHPLGINLDYFMDDDNYLHPGRRLADALKAMGVKYLRYPGGNKSDFYFFSRPPYDKSIPTLARTGKDAVAGRNKALDSSASG